MLGLLLPLTGPASVPLLTISPLSCLTTIMSLAARPRAHLHVEITADICLSRFILLHCRCWNNMSDDVTVAFVAREEIRNAK